MGRHRVDGVVHVEKPEAAHYQAVSKHPDRADRLLHRDVATVARELERAEHHDSIVAGNEVRRRDAPDVEQLENGVEVLPEPITSRVSGTALSRRECRAIFAVVLEERQTAFEVLARLSKGKHEWVYELARKGFELGRNYRCIDGFYIPKEAKWRPRHVSDYRLVQHDLQVNAWVMAYRRLVGEEIADWLGPEQGRIDVPTRYEDRRFKPMTLDHANHEMSDYTYIRDLRRDTFAPVVPDATLKLDLDEGPRALELLIELDRTARPAKNVVLLA